MQDYMMKQQTKQHLPNYGSILFKDNNPLCYCNSITVNTVISFNIKAMSVFTGAPNMFQPRLKHAARSMKINVLCTLIQYAQASKQNC